MMLVGFDAVYKDKVQESHLLKPRLNQVHHATQSTATVCEDKNNAQRVT